MVCHQRTDSPMRPSAADPLVVYVAAWEAPSVAAAVQRDARLGVLLESLAARAVAVHPWSDLKLVFPESCARDPEAAARHGAVIVGGDELWRADALLLRASDLATGVCESCDGVAFDDDAARAHAAATGHELRSAPAAPLRWFLQAAEVNRSLLRHRAFVFDCDEGLPVLEAGGLLSAESVRRAVRLADLTIVTTAAGADAVHGQANAVRVVPYGVDPAWGINRASTRPAGGAAGRLNVAVVGPFDAARAMIEQLGLDGLPVSASWVSPQHGADPRLDHVAPALALDDAPRRLAALDSDVAIIPAAVDPAAVSLWWLLFSLAGVPVVMAHSETSAEAGSSPTVDDDCALAAHGPDDWRAAVRRLSESPSLGQRMVAASRARIEQRHDLRDAGEALADALQWGVEHAGWAVASRQAPAAGPARSSRLRAVEQEAAATLAHSRLSRRKAAEDRLTLERLRDRRDVCWPETDAQDPLVTVQIATYDRGQLAVDRAIRSALAQTYSNIEVLVVGDCAPPEAARAIAAVDDPRVRFVNLPVRGAYPSDPEHRWMVAGAAPMNRGLELARGAWLAPLDDDDVFPPDHVETLLSLAIEHRLEFVYGQAECELPDGRWSLVGDWPPHQGGIAHGAVLYSSRLRFFEYDPEAWRNEEPGDWCLWRRMVEAGVRMGFVEQIVFRHYAEGRHREYGRATSVIADATPTAAGTPMGRELAVQAETGGDAGAGAVGEPRAADDCSPPAESAVLRLSLSRHSPPPDGWVVADAAIPGSASRGRTLPFPDATVDRIHAVDVVDDLRASEAASFLTEARRVLRERGVLRLGLPVNTDGLELDAARAAEMLARLGFSNIVAARPGESRFDDLRRLEPADAPRVFLEANP